MELAPADWLVIFAPTTPVLELVVRATALYLGILIIIRVMPRRTGGELSTMDLVFVVLIAQAATPAMGEYTAVGDGIIVIATLVGWNVLINFLSQRVPAFEPLFSSPPLKIIENGELLRRNLRREFVTEEELMSHLREQGIERVEDVKVAFVEPEGKITTIAKQP